MSLFDTAGTFVRSVVTDRAKDIAVMMGDTIWGSRMPGREFMVWALPQGGGTSRSMIAVDQAHSSFAPDGAVARLGRDARGELLVADDRPGLWYTRTSGAFSRHGRELLPGARFVVRDGIAVPPASTSGIGALQGGRVAIAYVKHTVPRSRQERPSHAAFIAVFGSRGELLGEIPLGSTRVAVFATSRDGQFVYLPSTEPFPRVVKYRVVSR